MAASEPLIPDRYIGDQVFASYDGYHVVLELRGGSENTTLRGLSRILLEPHVLHGLDVFRSDIKKRFKELEQERIAKDNAKSD